jgi:hypothetical protein
LDEPGLDKLAESDLRFLGGLKRTCGFIRKLERPWYDRAEFITTRLT